MTNTPYKMRPTAEDRDKLVELLRHWADVIASTPPDNLDEFTVSLDRTRPETDIMGQDDEEVVVLPSRVTLDVHAEGYLGPRSYA